MVDSNVLKDFDPDKETDHYIEEFKPDSFYGIKGISYSAVAPEKFKLHERVQLEVVKTKAINHAGRPMVTSAELSVHAHFRYKLMVGNSILEFLKKNAGTVRGNYFIVHVEYPGLPKGAEYENTHHTYSKLMKDIPPINHNGGCFNFDKNNGLNIWLY